MAHPGGRPTLYTQELAEKICKAVSSSDKSLRKICEENDDFPTGAMVWHWMVGNPEFSDMYRKAKIAQADFMIDQISEISDNEEKDLLVNKDGVLVPNTAKIARDRLKVDTRKWIATKLIPRIYGEKSQVETHTTVSVSADTNKKVSDVLSLIEEK